MILADTGYLVALARPRDALHRGPTRPNDPRDRPAGAGGDAVAAGW